MIILGYVNLELMVVNRVKKLKFLVVASVTHSLSVDMDIVKTFLIEANFSIRSYQG